MHSRFLFAFYLLALPLVGQSVITPSSGIPGPAPTIKIRCGSTFNTTEALYIIDGRVSSFDKLTSVKAEDIDAVHVIRDGDPAMALFGARAQNGVILITTKTGHYAEPDRTLYGVHLAPGNLLRQQGRYLSSANGNIGYLIDGKKVNRKKFAKLSSEKITVIYVYKGEEKAKEMRYPGKHVVVSVQRKE